MEKIPSTTTPAESFPAMGNDANQVTSKLTQHDVLIVFYKTSARTVRKDGAR